MVPMYVLIQYIYILYMYICVCVRACVCVRDRQFPNLSQPYRRLVPLVPLEFTGQYSATTRRAAVTRVRGGANMNCMCQLRAIFFAPLYRVSAAKILCMVITRWAL
jgi:hypothetical protein